MLGTALPFRLSARVTVFTSMLVMIETSCATLRSYDQGVTPLERLEECRLLDRKVTEAGQLNAIGVFLAGGAGLTAGLKDGNRQAFGYVSGVFGLFAAFAQYLSSRQSSRFASRNCSLVLDGDPRDSIFTNGIKALQRTSYRRALDSLKALAKPPKEQN